MDTLSPGFSPNSVFLVPVEFLGQLLSLLSSRASGSFAGAGLCLKPHGLNVEQGLLFKMDMLCPRHHQPIRLPFGSIPNSEWNTSSFWWPSEVCPIRTTPTTMVGTNGGTALTLPLLALSYLLWTHFR